MRMRGAGQGKEAGQRRAERSRSIAQSPILGTTITLKRLEHRGYVSLLDHYLKVAP
jgi:hypothetical protein